MGEIIYKRKTLAGVAGDAVEVNFDSTATNLEGNNVQDAIQELDAEVNNVQDAIQELDAEVNNVQDAIQELDAEVTSLNSSLTNRTTTTTNKVFYADEQNGKLGINTDPERGADTFTPFKSGGYQTVISSWKFNDSLGLGSINFGDEEPLIQGTINVYTTVVTAIKDCYVDTEGSVGVKRGEFYSAGSTIYSGIIPAYLAFWGAYE